MTSLPALILDLLQRHAVIPATTGWRAVPASGGTTDRTFRILDPNGQPAFVARLARPGLGDWLRHEATVLHEIGSAATHRAPSQVTLIEDATLPHALMLVHAYVTGAPAPLATLSPAAMQSLGTCLSWVHTHPRSGYMHWPSLTVHQGTRAACYRARLAALQHVGATEGILQEVDTLLDKLATIDLPASAGWDEPGFALIHGDLSRGNILVNEDTTVALIDWEYARDGDPAEDLAYLIAEQDPPPAVIADLADAYINASGDPWAFARVPAWLPLVALDSALWWTSHLLQRSEPLDNPIIRTHLDRARRYLGS